MASPSWALSLASACLGRVRPTELPTLRSLSCRTIGVSTSVITFLRDVKKPLIRNRRLWNRTLGDNVAVLKPRFSWLCTLSILFVAVELCRAQQTVADTSGLDFKQFGLLAIQDGGRRKPVDTFA